MVGQRWWWWQVAGVVWAVFVWIFLLGPWIGVDLGENRGGDEKNNGGARNEGCYRERERTGCLCNGRMDGCILKRINPGKMQISFYESSSCLGVNCTDIYRIDHVK